MERRKKERKKQVQRRGRRVFTFLYIKHTQTHRLFRAGAPEHAHTLFLPLLFANANLNFFVIVFSFFVFVFVFFLSLQGYSKRGVNHQHRSVFTWMTPSYTNTNVRTTTQKKQRRRGTVRKVFRKCAHTHTHSLTSSEGGGKRGGEGGGVTQRMESSSLHEPASLTV